MQVVIFSWPQAAENANLIFETFRREHINPIVIDSSDFQNHPDWLTIESDSYYGDQFSYFIGNVKKNHENYLLIQADVTIVDCKSLFLRMKHISMNKNIGIVEANIDYSYWNSKKYEYSDENVDIPEGYSLTVAVDSTCWLVTSKVLQYLHSHTKTFPKFGYGIDIVSSVIAQSHNLLVLRDKMSKVIHRKGSGYKEDIALAQMEIFLKNFPKKISKRTKEIIYG